MTKPSIQEIAEMPYPASMMAMREHYNPDWHKPEPDGETLMKYRVTMDFAVRDSRTYTVEALDEEHAEKLADDALNADKSIPHDAEDFEMSDIELVTS